MTEEIPRNARFLTMEYKMYYTIGIDEDINHDAIDTWWVKWGTLFIEMKDGTVYEFDAETNVDSQETWTQGSINWKNGQENLMWRDKYYTVIEEDE